MAAKYKTSLYIFNNDAQGVDLGVKQKNLFPNRLINQLLSPTIRVSPGPPVFKVG